MQQQPNLDRMVGCVSEMLNSDHVDLTDTGKLQVAGRALKESEHIVTRFQDLESAFLSDASLRYDDGQCWNSGGQIYHKVLLSQRRTLSLKYSFLPSSWVCLNECQAEVQRFTSK